MPGVASASQSEYPLAITVGGVPVHTEQVTIKSK